MDVRIKNSPCKECSGEEAVLHKEVVHLREHLAERDAHYTALEAEFFKCTSRANCLEDQVSNWKEKYERLYDSHKRVQKLNQVLEDKLLQMVDKMKSEKSQLTKDIATLSVRLAESKHNYSMLQKENERYKNDMNLAIQLLQCKPDNFVSHKLDNLPADTQARVSQYVAAKAPKPAGADAEPDAGEFEFDVSASLMAKILEDSARDSVTKHCDTCTCAGPRAEPFRYDEARYSVATQTAPDAGTPSGGRSAGAASRASSAARSAASARRGALVGPGPRFCHLRLQAGSENVLLDDAEPDAPPVLYRRQSGCNESAIFRDAPDAPAPAAVAESTLVDVRVDGERGGAALNPALLRVSSSPLRPLRAHDFSADSEREGAAPAAPAPVELFARERARRSASSLSSDDSAALLQKQQLLRVAEWVEKNLEQRCEPTEPLDDADVDRLADALQQLARGARAKETTFPAEVGREAVTAVGRGRGRGAASAEELARMEYNVKRFLLSGPRWGAAPAKAETDV